MKYPREYKGVTELINIPEFSDNTYWCAKFNTDGTTTKSGFAGHKTEESCWICCMAHNQRIGYSRKKVDKIVNKIRNGKRKKTKKEKK